MNKKKELGQFFTTNASEMLEGFGEFVAGKKVIDPFAGKGDLLEWSSQNNAHSTAGFDIDDSLCDGFDICHRDSIKEPVSSISDREIVVTNPPYLSLRKGADLYHDSLRAIKEGGFNECIVIIPINFLSAPTNLKIRNDIFSYYYINKMKIFKDKSFKDTTINVVVLHLVKWEEEPKMSFEVDGEVFNKEDGWVVGGSFVREVLKHKNKLNLRINHGQEEMTEEQKNNNILMFRAVDLIDSRLCLFDRRESGIDEFVAKRTARVTVQFLNDLSIEEQLSIIDKVNSYLNSKRDTYYSMFLCNFRDNYRKRCSFELMKKLINKVYYEQIKG